MCDDDEPSRPFKPVHSSLTSFGIHSRSHSDYFLSWKSHSASIEWKGINSVQDRAMPNVILKKTFPLGQLPKLLISVCPRYKKNRGKLFDKSSVS